MKNVSAGSIPGTRPRPPRADSSPRLRISRNVGSSPSRTLATAWTCSNAIRNRTPALRRIRAWRRMYSSIWFGRNGGYTGTAMPPASITPRKLLKKSSHVGSMIATVSPGSNPDATRPAATRDESSSSWPWLMSCPPSPSRRWMWILAGSCSARVLSTSENVRAPGGGAAASRDGCRIGQRAVRSELGSAESAARTQSAGVSELCAAVSGRRRPSAVSRRTRISTRSRLPSPRSRSRDERSETLAETSVEPSSYRRSRTVASTAVSTAFRSTGRGGCTGALRRAQSAGPRIRTEPAGRRRTRPDPRLPSLSRNGREGRPDSTPGKAGLFAHRHGFPVR